MPKNIALLYATTDGHTRKIADYIAFALRRHGRRCDLINAKKMPTAFSFEGYDGAIVGASVHAGKHQKEIVDQVCRHRTALRELTSAFFSVSLAVLDTDPNKQAEGEKYIQQFLSKTGWQPTLQASFAGALLYTQYGLAKRLLMKTITRRAGGDTDTSQDHEYTDWHAVDTFIARYEHLLDASDQQSQVPLQ